MVRTLMMAIEAIKKKVRLRLSLAYFFVPS